MGAKHDQLKQELSKLSHEEVMDRAVNYAIELDREQKMRLAEKQIYKNVQQRSQKLEEQNKELENSIAVFGSLFVELLKLIHDSTTKLNACIAAYDELKIQLQHSQEVNIGLNDKVYAPSTERLDSLVPSTRNKAKEEEVPQNVCDDSCDDDNEDDDNDTTSEQDPDTSETADIIDAEVCTPDSDKNKEKNKPQKRSKIKGKRAYDLSFLPCREYHDEEALKGLDEKYGIGDWEVAFWEPVDSVEVIPAIAYRKRVYRPVIRVRIPDPVVGAVYELVRLPHEVPLIEKSLVTSSLLSYILHELFVMFSPLCRQENSSLLFDAFPVTRQTLSRWVITAAERLKPLYDYPGDLLLQQSYLQCDETRWNVIRDEKSQNWFWLQRTSELSDCQQIIIFEYETGRDTGHLVKLFADLDKEICVTSDAYSSYFSIQKQKDGLIILCGCFMHARRYFADALKIKKQKHLTDKEIDDLEETKIIKMIGEIYHADEALKTLTAEERKLRRDSEVRPLVDKFFDYVHAFNVSDPLVIEKMKEAIHYSIAHEEELRQFLNDGNIPIDNGASERAIRPIALLRRNVLFSTSIRGAKAVATFMSLIATAQEAQADVYTYLKYLLEHSLTISKGKANLDDMLPWSEAYQNYEEQEKKKLETLIPTKNNDPPITPKILRKQAIPA